MALLIDSSVIIELERRGLPADTLILALPGEDLALSALTASELLFGVYRADSAERRLRRQAFVESVLSGLPVFVFDFAVARVHSRLGAQLAEAGRPIGAHDLLIAATAIAHGYDVLTANVRDFGGVPGLTVRQPMW